jgi:hypothetical protein
MRWIMICLGTAAFLGLVLVWRIAPEKDVCYRELTVTQWEAEILSWEPWTPTWDINRLRFTTKGRRQTVWVTWLSYIGIKAGESHRSKAGEKLVDFPLLVGDPAAVPVLVELLGSREPQVRLIAAQGLWMIGEQALPAVPALLRRLDDKDEAVREQVETTLFHLESESPEGLGPEWEKVRPQRSGSFHKRIRVAPVAEPEKR